MTTSIGTCTLDRDMVWEDEYLWHEIIAEVKDTISGGFAHQEIKRSSEKGRPITLASIDGQGSQKKSTVDALKVLANTSGTGGAAKTYTLTITHNSITVTKTVRFRNEASESGAVEFELRTKCDGNPKTTAWYDGKIYLMVWS